MAKRTLEHNSGGLLTHTETHEFHHKGQIVLFINYFGYPPLTQTLVNSIVLANELL